MKVISVNLGTPRTVEWQGRKVTTAFFKEPVRERIRVHKIGLEGDAQADLRVHGGVNKAVYAYPSEHYDYWREELPEVKFPWGSFGENLTTQGLLESYVRIGDTLRVGSAELAVTRPRLPCFKMNVRFQRNDMMQRFGEAARSGFYLSVVREGAVQAEDEIQLFNNNSKQETILQVFRASLAKE